MQSIQAKPSEEIFARETQRQAVPPQRKNIAEPASIKYLRVALQLVGGRDLYCRNLHAHPYLAIWLVVAHRLPYPALSSDDSGCLCDAGGFSVNCQPQTARTFEPHLVHGVVQFCARRNHGSAGFGEPRAQGTPLGRRPGCIRFSSCPCASDGTRCGGKARLKGGQTDEPGIQHAWVCRDCD